MTTIACTIKLMVGDRKLVQGDEYTLVTKIFKLKNGELVGAAGEFGDTETFLEWYSQKNKKTKPKLNDDFEGLVLNKEGIFWIDSSLYPVKIERTQHYAIGTGSVAALCLMDKGTSAKEAIEHVSKYDNLTSFETDTLEL